MTKELVSLLKVRTIHAVLVALLVTVQYMLQLAATLGHQPYLFLETFVAIFTSWTVNYAIGFAVISFVQARLAPGRRRVLALIASVLVWSSLFMLLRVRSPFIVVDIGLVTQKSELMDSLWTNIVYLLLATWYYESVDRARRSTAAWRESELARRAAERWLLELRLSSLQARLDPRVLFDTLDEAIRLYRSQPGSGERLLDELIEYLRRALPQLRQPESTLEREIDVAVAYGRILRSNEGNALELESAIEPTARDARFPPMVVQPLCDTLARAVLASAGPAHVLISASRDKDVARLSMTAQPMTSVPAGERLAELRHTLETMFAPLVRVEAAMVAPATARVLVEIPYVAAARVDR